MRAELKRLHSPDTFDLAHFVPEDPTSFAILLQAMIGPAGEAGEESFSIQVCTPRWLEQNLPRDEVLVARHMLLTHEYDLGKIVAAITKFLSTCTGASWQEIGEKVSRLGYWEFEDYRE